MAARRLNGKQRATPAAQDGHLRDAPGARALADATARISDQSGRLNGEHADGATAEDAAHWIAVYSELLSFKAELLEITARRRGSMSKDARGEAEADDVVIGAQAARYTRRLREWRAQVATGSPVTPSTPAFAAASPQKPPTAPSPGPGRRAGRTRPRVPGLDTHGRSTESIKARLTGRAW